MIRYLMMKETMRTADGRKYDSYGIRMLNLSPDGFEVMESVSDISTDADAVRNLVQRCNAGNLHPIHLMDVVVDFLNA